MDGHQAEGWFHYLHQDPAYMRDWVDRFDRWRTTGVLEIPAITAFLDAEATELVAPDNNGTASFADPNPGTFRGFYRVAAGFAP